MTATILHLPAPRTDAAPDLTTWAAAGLIMSGFTPEDAVLAVPPCSAAALALAMEKLSLAEAGAVERIWNARLP